MKTLRYLSSHIGEVLNKKNGLCRRSNSSRKLLTVFTIRTNKIRIISVRDMSKKERAVYENYKKENSKI